MSTTAAQTSDREIRARTIELGEAELAKVSGGYIGETEKNLTLDRHTDTASPAAHF